MSSDNSEIWFDDVQVVEVDPYADPSYGYLLSHGADYDLWGESHNRRVFKDDPVPATSKSLIQIKGAKGETESFQLVIRPNSFWQNVTWSWNDFTGPATIPAGNMTHSRIEYASTSLPNRLNLTYRLEGDIPDPLPVETSSGLKANQNNPFWFLVDVPENVPAGTYRSNLTLKRGAVEITTQPVELTVWDFKIPSGFDSSLSVGANVWGKYITSYVGNNLPDDLISFY